jgi:hypothetical protein
MRYSLLLLPLTALLALPSFALPPSTEVSDTLSIQTAPPEKPASAEEKTVDDRAEHTTFNRMKVPPMKEINGEEFDTVVKEGYWYDWKRSHYRP